MSEDTRAFCPNCGEMDIKEDVCGSCGFSLGAILTCPQKQINGHCSKTKSLCKIENLDWEVCEIFRGGEEE